MRTLAPSLLAIATLAIPCVASAQDAPQGSAREESSDGRRMSVQPYIEASQVLGVELDPGNDVFTYTRLAAGVDAALVGQRSAVSASVRYEHQIGYGDRQDSDILSGLVRGAVEVVPNAVTFDAGAMATRTAFGTSGATLPGGVQRGDATSQIYSAYAGPSVRIAAADVLVEGHYHLGYTKVESPDAPLVAPGITPVNVADDTTTHSAAIRASTRPFTVLPVGLGAEAGFNEQRISTLDQRVSDKHVRGDVTVQVAPDLAFVAGAGYEDVEVSSRDAVRDADGNPVIGSDGRPVSDESAPRVIAYETEGLIWDVGVMWRPSRRTSLSATVGRRYGSMTYYGNLSYAPSARSSMQVSIYDNLSSFGGILTSRLAGLPTDFEAFRNPISGELSGCVASTEEGGCGVAILGSLRGSVFRSRGVTASYSHRFGLTSAGLAAGLEHREFIGAAGSALANVDGVADRTFWMAAYGTRRLDAQSDLTGSAYVSWFDSGLDDGADSTAYQLSLAYYRRIVAGLTGSAAVSLDGVTRDSLSDYQALSGMLGLRYGF